MLLHLDGRMHNKKLLCNVEMLTNIFYFYSSAFGTRTFIGCVSVIYGLFSDPEIPGVEREHPRRVRPNEGMASK